MGEIKRAAVASTARSQRPRSVMEACSQPDASTAAIARLYKLNADVVDRWRADQRKALAQQSPAAPALPQPDFIPIGVQPEMGPPPQDMSIELQRGDATALVHWPAESATSCAAWLRERLR